MFQLLAMVFICTMSLLYLAAEHTPKLSSEKEKSMTRTGIGSIYEIAMGVIKQESRSEFESLNQSTLKELATVDGYLGSHSYLAVDNDSVFLDIVEWESVDHAKAAAKVFETDDRFAAYMKAIQELTYFDHVSLIEDGQLQFKKLRDSDVLELTRFHLHEDSYDSFIPTRVPLMNLIGDKYDGFKQVTTVRSLGDPSLMIDMGIWENAGVCHLAQSELETQPLFLDFIKYMDLEKEPTMEFFRKIR